MAALLLGSILEGFGLEARADGVIVGGSQPTLAWNLSTNPQVAGYAVKSGIAGCVTNVQNAALADSVLLNNLITWKTNFIYVAAYDISGVEWAVSEVLYYYPTTAVSGVAAPVIAAQPSGGVAALGAGVTLAVAASSSSALSYQWYKDGAAIGGATQEAYTLASAQLADSGAYYVRVSNEGGAVASSAADLSVLIPPAITTQPAGGVVLQAATVTLSVGATGSGTLAYQWFKNGAMLNGATNDTLVLASAQTSDSGSYIVTVSNPVGQVVSGAAVLTVNALPVITAQPSSVVTLKGSSASFTVAASGAPAPSFQWYKDGVAIGGATSSKLALSNVQTAQSGAYTVVAINSVGQATSSVANLAVYVTPAISSHPQDVYTFKGSNASFTVVASGVPAPSYQWYKDGAALGGATSATLALSNLQAANSGTYNVKVSNAAGSVTSYSAILSVYVPPVITTQPASLISTQGTKVTISVAATGSGTLYYQWIKDGATMVGATSSSITFNSVQYADAGSYTVSIANTAGTIRSSAAVLTVCAPPAITTQPSSVFAFKGTNVTFTVAATGVPTPALQWYKDGVALAAATNKTLTLSNVQSTNAGVYMVTATNVGGKVTSYNATLTVYVPPTIATQPVARTVAPGSNVTFSVVATGSGKLYYQWCLNGNTLAGATSSNLTIANVQAANAGNYQVTIANSAGSVKSSVVTLTVTATGKASLAHQTATEPRAVRLVLRQAPQAGEGAKFMLATVPGTSYLIQASGNLADWEDVGTLPPATSTETEFADPDSAAHAMRFYRAVPVQ